MVNLRHSCPITQSEGAKTSVTGVYLYATSNITTYYHTSIIHSLHQIYYYLVLFARRRYVENKAGAEVKRSIQPGRVQTKPGFGHEGLSGGVLLRI